MKYWIKNLLRDIRQIPKEIKWFIQRGKTGLADCDWWCLDWYVTDIMIEGIERIMYNGNHVGCLGGNWCTKEVDGQEVVDFPLNDPEARRVHNLYSRIKRFFELHKLFNDKPEYWHDKSLRRKYKASGLLLIRNFGRLWD